MTVHVKVRPEKLKEFLQELDSLKAVIEGQKGLRKVSFNQNLDGQRVCSLIYEWESQEDLDRYLGMEEFRILLGAVKVLGEKSNIRYRHISEKLPDTASSAYES